MVTAVFQCSSPFVGYTIRVADRQKKEMTKCSAREMTELGWQIFQVSGTYAILMDHENRRYFHARQSESRAFDEQGRRIYTNVAFVGAPDNEQDCRTVTNIALYELFAPEDFYQRVAELIHLTDEGFEVDFEKLECFLTQLEKGPQCKTKSRQAWELWNEILHSPSHEKIRFVVLEATWEYFVKQAGTDFGRSVKRTLSLPEVRRYAEQTEVVFMEREENTPEKVMEREENIPEKKRKADNELTGETFRSEKAEEDKSELEKSGREDLQNEPEKEAALKEKLPESFRELETLREKTAEQKKELAALRGKLISAKTETDRLEVDLLRSKLFIIAAAAAGAVMAAVVCLVFFR